MGNLNKNITMKKIRLSQKTLSRTMIALVILILLSGFAWINSMVSYKYEVQDTIYSKQPLDQHQKDIIFDINSSKISFFSFLILLVITLFINEKEPTIKGRLYYRDKNAK